VNAASQTLPSAPFRGLLPDHSVAVSGETKDKSSP
jgi:hypothetical protein